MKSRLSAFMDGELPTSELDQLLAEIDATDSSATWRHYELMQAVVSDENIRLSHAEIYSADLTRRIMAQLSADEPEAAPRSADVLPFPERVRRWGVPLSLAASVAAAAIFLGAFESTDPESVAQNTEPSSKVQVAAAPAPTTSGLSTLGEPVVAAREPAAEDLAVNDELLVRSREPVESQVIPELNEFILQHNSIASSRHFQPTLSYARVVSHSAR